MTGPSAAAVKLIALEIEKMTSGRLAADVIGAETRLWGPTADWAALGLSSLDFFDLLYRLEDGTGVKAPESLEPAMVATVGDLALLFMPGPDA